MKQLWVTTVSRFPNKLAPTVPNNISRNPILCYFASCLIVSLTPFINKSDYSSELIVSIISFISLFEIISVVIPDPKMFFWTAASVDEAPAFNANGVKTHLVLVHISWRQSSFK